MIYKTMQNYTILYYTILYYIILYCTILYFFPEAQTSKMQTTGHVRVLGRCLFGYWVGARQFSDWRPFGYLRVGAPRFLGRSPPSSLAPPAGHRAEVRIGFCPATILYYTALYYTILSGEIFTLCTANNFYRL